MFKITPVADAARAQHVAAACGVSVHEGAFMYQMLDGTSEELLGMSQFEILGPEGVILDLKEAPGHRDFEAMFILGRATMNFIDMCGTHICRASADTAEDSFLRALGFKKDGDEYTVSMQGMFDGNCGGHTKNPQ